MKNVPALLWAALATPAAFLALAGSDAFSRTLERNSGLKVSPRFTGGEVVSAVDNGRYRTLLHRPVFDGVAGQRDSGFLQVDWRPFDALPPELTEDVPLPGGGKVRLKVRTASGEVACEGGGPQVRCEPESARFKNALVVRIKISKPLRRD